MPYGIVLIKEVPEHWRAIARIFNSVSLKSDNGIKMFKKTNTALLGWYRCFGWADFIALVWSPNVECIKNWVIEFRDYVDTEIKTNNKPKVPITTTIICVAEDELKNRRNEFRYFINNIEKIIYEDNIENVDFDEVIEEFNIARLKNFLEKLKKDIDEALEILANHRKSD